MLNNSANSVKSWRDKPYFYINTAPLWLSREMFSCPSCTPNLHFGNIIAGDTKTLRATRNLGLWITGCWSSTQLLVLFVGQPLHNTMANAKGTQRI